MPVVLAFLNPDKLLLFPSCVIVQRVVVLRFIDIWFILEERIEEKEADEKLLVFFDMKEKEDDFVEAALLTARKAPVKFLIFLLGLFDDYKTCQIAALWCGLFLL